MSLPATADASLMRTIEATLIVNGQPRTITRTVAATIVTQTPEAQQVQESSKKIPTSPSKTPSRRR